MTGIKICEVCVKAVHDHPYHLLEHHRHMSSGKRICRLQNKRISILPIKLAQSTTNLSIWTTTPADKVYKEYTGSSGYGQ